MSNVIELVKRHKKKALLVLVAIVTGVATGIANEVSHGQILADVLDAVLVVLGQ